jgi:hypothetical protein
MKQLETAYICDRKRCKQCSAPVCTKTTDIDHAANFKQIDDYDRHEYYYEEIEDDKAQHKRRDVLSSRSQAKENVQSKSGHGDR